MLTIRKMYCPEMRLKEILVQNYLNLNKFIFVIFSTVFILSYILFHYFIIEANKHVSNEKNLNGKKYLAPTGLVILAVFETIVQIGPFYDSFALRKMETHFLEPLKVKCILINVKKNAKNE